jgi:hypothetical protein
MGRLNHRAPIPKRYEATWLPKRYESDMVETETGSMLNQVIKALEDSVDSFTQHVAEDIIKRQSLAAKLDDLAKKTDMSRYIISVCYRLISMRKERERDELASIEKNGVWTRDQPPIHKDTWIKIRKALQ